MKKLFRACAVLALLCLLAGGSALADHIELPIKWSQLPDMEVGVDQYSVHGGRAVCTNDFLCTSPWPIGAVRWWGSYTDGYEPQAGRHPVFELMFHYDVPAGALDPDTGETLHFSHPLGHPWLALHYVPAQEEFYGNVTDASGQIIERVYEYNARLPVPFDQEYWREHDLNPVPSSGIFWLDIGYADDEKHDWGWHESMMDWKDFAIQNPKWHFGPWAMPPLPTILEKDLAFELMIVPEPATLTLLGLGGLSLLIRRRRRR